MSCKCDNIKAVTIHECACGVGTSLGSRSITYEVKIEDHIFGKPHVLPGTFVYRDKDNVMRRASIERVIYSNPATVVIWDDGTKTVCKCFANDQYNPETGLTVCILKKLVGGSAVKDAITAWLPEGDYKPGNKIVRVLSDVRALFKKK